MGEVITSDDILGREAIGPEGSILGTVVKLHVDRDNMKIIGITVDKGFMQPDLFIGTEYIKRFGVDAVFLNKVPKEKFVGASILTEEGKLVGHVKEIRMSGKDVHSIVMVSKVGAFKKEEIEIPVSKVREIGVSVILKKGFSSVSLR